MKKLLPLTIAIVVIAVGLIIGIVVRVVKTKVCLTPECVAVASNLILSINKDVKPCDNFYEHVCGNYVQSEGSVKQKWIKRAKEQFDDLFSEAPTGEDSIPHKNLKFFYRACMNEPEIERSGLKYVVGILEEFGGFPAKATSNFDWSTTSVKLRILGLFYESFLEYTVQRASNKRAYFTVSHSSKYIPTKEKEIDQFKAHIAKVVEAFSNDGGGSLAIASEIFDVMVELNEICHKNVNSTFQNSTLMTLGQVQLLHPRINHLELMKGIFYPVQLKEDDVIDFQVNSTINELLDLVARTPKRVLANLILWEVIVQLRIWLPREIRANVALTFPGNSDQTRHEKCIFHINQAYPYVAYLLYAMRYTSDHTLNIVAEVFAKVKDKYRQTLLEQFKWMDEDTKTSSLRKLDFMLCEISGRSGVSFADFSYIQVDYAKSDNYIAAFTSATSESLGFQFSQVNSTVLEEKRLENILYSAAVNAFYRTSNKIIMTPAMLQNVVYKEGFPKYLQYANLGYMIAHEMSHAFHSLVRWSLLDDDLENWWSNETEVGFDNATKCLVTSYEEYIEATFNRTLNGTDALEENFCDLVGQYVAYEVLRGLPQSHSRLPGLEDYTPTQLYWLQNVYLYCDPVENLDKFDFHAPPSFRTQFPIAQYDFFVHDFECSTGTNMSPTKKCIVF